MALAICCLLHLACRVPHPSSLLGSSCFAAHFVAQVVPTLPAAKVYLQDELSPLHKVGRPGAFRCPSSPFRVPLVSLLFIYESQMSNVVITRTAFWSEGSAFCFAVSEPVRPAPGAPLSHSEGGIPAMTQALVPLLRYLLS